MKAPATILSKLNKSDSTSKLDEWFKYFINEVEYKMDDLEGVSGTNVSVGETYTILIPFRAGYEYLPYLEWKNSDKQLSFTISPGDLIILGEHLSETVTPSNVQTIKNTRRSRVCEVRSIVEVRDVVGVKYRLKVKGI